jgi:hypothetical protein
MSRFFTGEGDTYDNAADKSAWRQETCSGRWDSSRVPGFNWRSSGS